MMKLVIRNVETKISRIRYTLEKMVERDHPYAQKMKEYGVKPEHIKTARDMQLLPYTTKQDLQEHYPLGWLNVDRKHVVRFHATSGDRKSTRLNSSHEFRYYRESYSCMLHTE